MENHILNSSESPVDHLLSPFKSPSLRRHFAPIHANINFPSELLGPKQFKQMTIGSDGIFRATIDIHDYEPEKITVKTVGHTIIVELSHADKHDEFGSIARNFIKKFVLPLNMDMLGITSWTSQGSLYLKVPSQGSDKPERIVEIKHA